MTMSIHGLSLLGEWEGVRLRVYLDSAGLPTIGVGHLLTHDERASGHITIGSAAIGSTCIDTSRGITREQAMALLARDVAVHSAGVSTAVAVPLTQHQFDALVSFSFNIGRSAFQSSTLVTRLNAGHYDEVPAQLRRWTRAGGRVVKGLVARREKEIALWEAA